MAHDLLYGFSICLQPLNILYCFLGVLMGTLIGVLPGIGPPGALALLIPVTAQLSPESAIIMLCGITYGSQYGGSTTSILVNIPGEPTAIVTCLDGYQMARQGRAGAALGISAFGSFIAGTLCIFGLILLAPVLSGFALKFGPPEYFALIVFSLSLLIFVAGGSLVRGTIMAALGMMLGIVGIDPTAGVNRFTFNIPLLMDGIGIVQVAIGLYGISEILVSLETYVRGEIYENKIAGLLPTRQDWQESLAPILRGTGIGFFLGAIPGIGVILPPFLSYGLEKRLAKEPGKFGTGAIAGVAGPEAANNAAAGGTLIPVLSLGIPTGASSALLLGALMIYGVQPGPLLIKEAPQVFWGLVASLYLGNVMLLLLNLPLIGLWVKLLKVPYHLLSVYILLFCVIGSYGIGYAGGDIIIMAFFGLTGYVARKANFVLTPLIIGLILGPALENAFRRSLIMSNGNFGIFFTRPISLTLFVTSALFLIWINVSKTRLSAMADEG